MQCSGAGAIVELSEGVDIKYGQSSVAAFPCMAGESATCKENVRPMRENERRRRRRAHRAVALCAARHGPLATALRWHAMADGQGLGAGRWHFVLPRPARRVDRKTEDEEKQWTASMMVCSFHRVRVCTETEGWSSQHATILEAGQRRSCLPSIPSSQMPKDICWYLLHLSRPDICTVRHCTQPNPGVPRCQGAAPVRCARGVAGRPAVFPAASRRPSYLQILVSAHPSSCTNVLRGRRRRVICRCVSGGDCTGRTTGALLAPSAPPGARLRRWDSRASCSSTHRGFETSRVGWPAVLSQDTRTIPCRSTVCRIP
jgi:hypothetical protein